METQPDTIKQFVSVDQALSYTAVIMAKDRVSPSTELVAKQDLPVIHALLNNYQLLCDTNWNTQTKIKNAFLCLKN